MKRFIALMLFASLITAAACGGNESTDTDTTAGDTTAAVTEPAETYDFPDIDLGGKSFVVANSETASWVPITTSTSRKRLNFSLYRKRLRDKNRSCLSFL